MILNSQCFSLSKSPILHHCFCFINIYDKPNSFSSPYTSEIALFVLPMMFISSAYPVNCTDLCNIVDEVCTYNCLITYSSAILKRLGASQSLCFKGAEVCPHSFLTSALESNNYTFFSLFQVSSTTIHNTVLNCSIDSSKCHLNNTFSKILYK